MSYKLKQSLVTADGIPVNCMICGDELKPVPCAHSLGGAYPAGIIFAGHAEGAGRYFLCSSEHLYVSGNGRDFVQLSRLEGGSPFMVEDVDEGTARAVVINGDKCVIHTGQSFIWTEYGANLSCGAMHCGRLFGADADDKTLLRWSGEGGVRDWSEGLRGSGSLKTDSERGDILNVVLYGGNLVLVRKYGLTLLNMHGSPENFSVDATDTDSEEILKNTACAVSGKLYFFTRSGLCSFDGSVIAKVSHRVERDISAPERAFGYAGRYYAVCASEFAGGKAVMCFEPDSGESFLLNVRGCAMCAEDGLRFYGPEGLYVLKEGGEFTYTVGLDFGSEVKKTVTKIIADCEGADIEIDNGRLKRTFAGARGVIRPHMRGTKFTVRVRGCAPIRALKAEAEVLDEI